MKGNLCQDETNVAGIALEATWCRIAAAVPDGRCSQSQKRIETFPSTIWTLLSKPATRLMQ